MPYFAVDDKLHSHPKAMRAGGDAMGLWVLAGSWSNDQGTDGFVPDYAAARLDPQYEAKAARLVSAGLWTTAERGDDRGWQFHQWAGDETSPKRNYTRAETEQKRREAAERQAKSRERRASVTRDVTRDNGVTHASVTPKSQRESRVTGSNAQIDPENVTRDSRVSHSAPALALPIPNPEVQVQNQRPPVVDPIALPNGKNSDEMPEEDKPAAIRSPLTTVRCPEHQDRKIGDCHWCKTEHGDRRWYADPSHWTRWEPFPHYRGDIARVTAWAART